MLCERGRIILENRTRSLRKICKKHFIEVKYNICHECSNDSVCLCAQDTRRLPSAAGRRRLDANARARLEMRVHVYPRVLPLSGGERPCQDQKEDAIMYTATPNVFIANSQITTTDTQTKDQINRLPFLHSSPFHVRAHVPWMRI